MIGRLLPLERQIVKRTIARSMDFIKRRGSQHRVIRGQIEGIMAGTANGRVKTLMIWAARITAADIINGPVVSIHKRAVDQFVAEHLPRPPKIDIGLCQPIAIGAKAGGWNRIPKHDEAFANWRARRKFTARRGFVGGIDIKGGQLICGLAWNGRAVDAIPRHRIPSRPIIHHANCGMGGIRVNPIK